MRNLIGDAFLLGQSGEEMDVTLLENVVIESDEEWWELFYKDVPRVLKRALSENGLSCTIYYKKDDVPGHRYLANCSTIRTGRRVALGFDVEYDHELGEVYLCLATAWRDVSWTKNQLTHYHEV